MTILTLSIALTSTLIGVDAKTEVLTVGGNNRTYRLTVPTQQESLNKVPLVVLLHGFSGNARIIEAYSGFANLVERERFVLVSPDGMGQPQGWNAGFFNLGKPGVDDLEFIAKLVDHVARTQSVDRSRIYAVGHSNGAMMINALAAMDKSPFAAVAGVAGIIGVGTAGSGKGVMSAPQKGISIMHVHGTDDKIVGFDRSASALLKGVPAIEAIDWLGKVATGGAKKQVEESTGKTIHRFSKDKLEVKLVELKNWSHNWPSKSQAGYDCTQEIWNFLKNKSR